MGCLRQLDKCAALVTMSFMPSRETANKINHAKTPSADKFLDLLFSRPKWQHSCLTDRCKWKYTQYSFCPTPQTCPKKN